MNKVLFPGIPPLFIEEVARSDGGVFLNFLPRSAPSVDEDIGNAQWQME